MQTAHTSYKVSLSLRHVTLGLSQVIYRFPVVPVVINLSIFTFPDFRHTWFLHRPLEIRKSSRQKKKCLLFFWYDNWCNLGCFLLMQTSHSYPLGFVGFKGLKHLSAVGMKPIKVSTYSATINVYSYRLAVLVLRYGSTNPLLLVCSFVFLCWLITQRVNKAYFYEFHLVHLFFPFSAKSVFISVLSVYCKVFTLTCVWICVSVSCWCSAVWCCRYSPPSPNTRSSPTKASSSW